MARKSRTVQTGSDNVSDAVDDLVEVPESADEVELEWGRRPPFSQVPDWVVLAKVRPQAKAVYWALAMHLNSKRVKKGNRLVWPGRAFIADALGYAGPKGIDTYIKELEKLGAIDVERGRTPDGMRARNKYIVHGTPPSGYQGFTCQSEASDAWDERQAAKKAAESVAAGEDVGQISALREGTQPPSRRGGRRTPVGGGDDPRLSAGVPRNKTKLNKTKLNQTKNPPPPNPPTAAAPTLVPDPAASAGTPAAGKGTDGTDRRRAAEFLAGLPHPWTPGGQVLEQILPVVDRLLAGGWTEYTLRRRLTDNPDGARNHARVLASRVRELPDQPPTTRTVASGPSCDRHPGAARRVDAAGSICGSCWADQQDPETRDDIRRTA